MPQSSLPIISECITAFDLDQKRFLTIGPCISTLAGFSKERVATAINFWYDIIHPDDLQNATIANSNAAEGQSTIIDYRIIPVKSTNTRYITEKRSIYTDAVTGHKILLSIINEHTGGFNTSPGSTSADEILKREQFLLALINSQTNFLIRLDRTGHFTFVNKQYCKVMGYTEEEIIGKHFSFTTAPEDMSLCEWAFENCLHNPGKMIPLMRDKIDKQGKKHPTEWEFISVTDEKGEVTEIQGVGQDISQRVEIESQVKRTAEKLDHFIESITDSFFIVDNNWRFIKVNSGFEKVSGKHRAEIMGANIWETYPWISGTAFEENYRKAVETQKTVQFMAYVDESKQWFRSTVYPSAEGLTVFMKNITKQIAAQEELNWARINLESLINNTEDLIWSIDKNDKYIYTNNAYKNTIGKATGRIPVDGREVDYEGYDEATIKQWRGFYKKAYQGERYVITNETTDPLTHKRTCYEISFNPIYKNTGEVTGVGCFARDITQRLKTEREILKQNERLKQIASLSSHELRRPVASMLGLINIIDFQNFNNPENKEIIAFLLEVSTEIDDVIKEIVDNTFTD